MDTALNNVPALDAQKKIWRSLTPQNRLGSIEDLNGLAVLLASDASAFMTGSNVIIDGGYTLYWRIMRWVSLHEDFWGVYSSFCCNGRLATLSFGAANLRINRKNSSGGMNNGGEMNSCGMQKVNGFAETMVERFFGLAERWLAGVFRRLLLLEVIKWRIGFCNLCPCVCDVICDVLAKVGALRGVALWGVFSACSSVLNPRYL